MSSRVVELLEKLSNALGISGFEDEVRSIMIGELEKFCDSVEVDKLGNVIGKREGKGPTVLLTAHMDEVGFMVRYIDDKGFIKFVPVGGWDPRVIPEQRVLIKTEKDLIPGIIGMKPVHIVEPEEAKKAPKIEDLFIDVGASSKEEAEKWGIKPGCPIFPDSKFKLMKNGKMAMGKAFDDRVGCVVLIRAMELLKDVPLDAKVYAVGTIQEEMGLRGAFAATFETKPDIGLALDVCIPGDMPGLKEYSHVQLGKGPAIGVREARMVAHPKVVRMLVEAAEAEGIPYQYDIIERGATDSSAMQITAGGTAVSAVNVPTRYIHSHTGVVHLDDVENAAKLVAAFLKRLKADVDLRL